MNETHVKGALSDLKDANMSGDRNFGRGEINEVQQQERHGANTSSNVSALNNKKRMKASRACDQCRRRKIKCDFSEEKGICTSCSKNGEKCAFERVPLKRGPSKGYTRSDSKSRSQSFSSDANHNNSNHSNYNTSAQDLSSSTSRQNPVLLPPLAQYIPQSGGGPLASNSIAASTALGSQQFWKVPYHEFTNSRRGSIDSLQSDLSMKSLNPPQDQQLLYTTPTGSSSHGYQSPTNISSGAVSNEQRTGYWSLANRPNQTHIFVEDGDEMRKKSGSFPPILRNLSSSSVTNKPSQPPQQHQQTLYPYSQFSQQRPAINPSLSSFGQFGANGYQSRQGSIASEGMSPSAPILHPAHSLTHIGGSVHPTLQVNNDDDTQKKISQHQQSQQHANPLPKGAQQLQPNASPGSKKSKKNNESRRSSIKKKRKIMPHHKKSQSSNSNVSLTSNNSSVPYGSENASSRVSNMSHGVIYGQISDVDLIDTYYEFIHTGFPIIPLNKKTLTNEILLVNTQPISAVHEVNNYVIIWFRNSLELLVRVSLKKRYNHFFENSSNDGTLNRDNDSNSNNDNDNDNDNNNDNDNYNDIDNDNNKSNKTNGNNIHRFDDETLEVKAVFINALNECLQKIVDIHPRFREIKQQISPKIKVIYLSTFILLNYILAVVGYDNSFVLGMSVTIFKEFKIHELFLFDASEENKSYLDDSTTETESDDTSETSIMFKRLYVLLIIFDALQSCLYGGPKLINIPIYGSTERFFEAADAKWAVDEGSRRMQCILKSVKLGELINEIAMNRRSICDYSGENPTWAPKSKLQIVQKEGGTLALPELFHDFLITKIKMTNGLLTLQNDIGVLSGVTESLCELISLTLKTLSMIIKLNPTNRIDYNFRPIEKSEEPPAPEQDDGFANTSGNPQGNEIYQKLLGLQQDAKDGQSNISRGVVSPYCVAVVDEISNVIELIKQLPTSLIGVVVQNTLDVHATIKPQDLIVRLSNSMNNIVTITSLLNMIKPLKLRDHQENAPDSAPRRRCTSSESVMARLYRDEKKRARGEYRGTEDTDKPGVALDGGPASLDSFIAVGWKLLDDSELGWC